MRTTQFEIDKAWARASEEDRNAAPPYCACNKSMVRAVGLRGTADWTCAGSPPPSGDGCGQGWWINGTEPELAEA